MKRDLCYFYPVPVQPVFDAFVQAAKQRFGKNCKIDPYKTVNFGLDYSFRYNMNGGALTIHFMPYNNGTAIDMRYTVVQAFGARYQKHADDVLIFVNTILRAQAQPIQLDVNTFLAYEAGVPSSPMNAAPQPVQQAQPVLQTAPVPPQPQQVDACPPQAAQQAAVSAPQPIPHAQPVLQKRFCTNCGAPIVPNAKFCMKCGSKLI